MKLCNCANANETCENGCESLKDKLPEETCFARMDYRKKLISESINFGHYVFTDHRGIMTTIIKDIADKLNVDYMKIVDRVREIHPPVKSWTEFSRLMEIEVDRLIKEA